MPYTKNSELPNSVRDHLPEHAQDIYRETFNSAYDTYAEPQKRTRGGTQEEAAHRAAWASVKHQYKKEPNGDQWVRKDGSEASDDDD